MIRLFQQHRIRKQQELEGMWDFVREDGRKYSLPVPGCWEQHPKMQNFRGKGTFYKKVFVDKTTNLRLEFKGVSHTADVYFDDAFIMHHYNAFTPFSGIVKKVAAGEHVIRVEVDNTFGEHSALHTPNDYYTYGGIVRPAVMEEVDDTFIENVHFLPFRKDGVWQAEITVKVRNVSDCEKNITIGSTLTEQKIWSRTSVTGEEEKAAEKSARAYFSEEQTCTAAPDQETVVQYTMSFPEAKEWSMEEPNLYMLSVSLKQNGENYDDYVDRVGFRTVEIVDNKFYLNGKKVFLKGFNRHEDYGVIGCAIPPQLMVQDMDIMQDLGANAVRTCHYPNDERFLDLCDERGMLVWEENHARGFVLKDMQNPNFEKQCEDCIDEMIEKHYNHPSIVIWGILNECASETPEGREMYQKQYGQIKRLDTSRPTTSATCRHFTDICLDLPDIVSFNMYSGWYVDVSIEERHNQQMDWIASTGGAGKPVIVSEFGAAAIYGFRDRGRSKWSEERQEDIIRENLEVYQKDDRLMGAFIWQFADCRVTEEGGWFATRARCHNNKGILDEYRRPKQAYDMIKDMFGKM